MQCSVGSGLQGGGPGVFITWQPQQARSGQPAAPATSAWPRTSASMPGSGDSRRCSRQGPGCLASSGSSLRRSGHRKGGWGGPREEAVGGGATGAGQKVPEWPEDTWQERNRLGAERRAGGLVAPTAGRPEASSGESLARASFSIWKWEVIPQGSGAPRAQARMLLPAHLRQTWGCRKPQKIDPPGMSVCSPRPVLAWSAAHLLHVVGPVASAALSTLEFSMLHSSRGASPASSPAPSRCFVILSQRGAWHSLYKRKGNSTRGPSSLAGGGAPPQPRPPPRARTQRGSAPEFLAGTPRLGSVSSRAGGSVLLLPAPPLQRVHASGA